MLIDAPADQRIDAAQSNAGRRNFGVDFKIKVDTGASPSPMTGNATGELFVRGNTIISGYFRQ